MLDVSSIATWAATAVCAAALLAGAALCCWRSGPRRRRNQAAAVHARYQAMAEREAEVSHRIDPPPEPDRGAGASGRAWGDATPGRTVFVFKMDLGSSPAGIPPGSARAPLLDAPTLSGTLFPLPLVS